MTIISSKWSYDKNRAPAVFLDRDGTLVVHKDVYGSPQEMMLLPGVAEGLRKLQDAGYLLLVVTNQPNVEKGLNTVEDVRTQHEYLRELLAHEGVELDAAYACPHKYPSTCSCRKPEIGLIQEAQKDFEIDMTRSWLVGDTGRDMETAKRANIRGARIASESKDDHFDTPGFVNAGSAAQTFEFISARMAV